ncbi:MAG: hypothetical protein ACE5HX_15270 [bacterium]
MAFLVGYLWKLRQKFVKEWRKNGTYGSVIGLVVLAWLVGLMEFVEKRHRAQDSRRKAVRIRKWESGW